MEIPAEMSIVAAYVPLWFPLYYTAQGVRATVVHRNPEMGVNGYATLKTERLNYQKVPLIPSFNLMQNPSL